MKRSQIVLFSIFIVITAIIFVVLKSNQKEQPKTLKEENKMVNLPVKKVKNSEHRITLVSYGQIAPNRDLIVSFEVQGKIKEPRFDKGEITLKPGTNFRKDQILYRLSDQETFYTLASRKTALSNLVISALPDIDLDFPEEKNKWMRFLNGISPGSLLPELPLRKSAKEEMFFTSRNILTEYYNTRSLEERVNKYIFVAPFDGTVLEVYAEPGAVVNPGVQVAKIAKTGDYEVKVPVAMEDLTTYKDKSTAEFIDPSGKNIGTGKILRISDVINQQTQSADVYYSIKAVEGEQIYNGMFVNVSINKEATKETVVLPRTAMANGKVNILKGNKIESIGVTVVGSIPDSIFVTGLKDGQTVVLEQMGSIEPDVKYEGIIR